MKKLIAVLALVLLASPAFAAISGSKHDMNNASGDIATNTTEICVFCHTPHAADTSVTDAPLWNRTTVSLAATSPYVGLDLENTLVAADYTDTDAPLCLSCHDGLVGETLQNEPNIGSSAISAGYVMTATANLSADMSDDHPIGFNYLTVAATDSGTDAEIRGQAAAEGLLGAGALQYGPGNDMWCSSCHDVHNNTNAPFLRINNAGSNLCLACHIK